MDPAHGRQQRPPTGFGGQGVRLMCGMWAGSLSLAIGIGIGRLHAEEVQWRPPATSATKPAAPLGPPALLGRPVAIPADAAAAIEDSQVVPTSYQGNALPPQAASLAP